MYFDASERLLLDGVAGQGELESVDTFLGARTGADRLYPAVVATTLGLPEQTIRAILDGLKKEGQLWRETEYVCPHCGIGVERRALDEAAEASDEFACPGTCGKDLAGTPDLEERTVYGLVMTPGAGSGHAA
jgi:DNA-directed RNA polymerase subunit RPC12/RpoP